jgi:hypothetical protein
MSVSGGAPPPFGLLMIFMPNGGGRLWSVRDCFSRSSWRTVAESSVGGNAGECLPDGELMHLAGALVVED